MSLQLRAVAAPSITQLGPLRRPPLPDPPRPPPLLLPISLPLPLPPSDIHLFNLPPPPRFSSPGPIPPSDIHRRLQPRAPADPRGPEALDLPRLRAAHARQVRHTSVGVWEMYEARDDQSTPPSACSCTAGEARKCGDTLVFTPLASTWSPIDAPPPPHPAPHLLRSAPSPHTPQCHHLGSQPQCCADPAVAAHGSLEHGGEL